MFPKIKLLMSVYSDWVETHKKSEKEIKEKLTAINDLINETLETMSSLLRNNIYWYAYERELDPLPYSFRNGFIRMKDLFYDEEIESDFVCEDEEIRCSDEYEMLELQLVQYRKQYWKLYDEYLEIQDLLLSRNYLEIIYDEMK